MANYKFKILVNLATLKHSTNIDKIVLQYEKILLNWASSKNTIAFAFIKNIQCKFCYQVDHTNKKKIFTKSFYWVKSTHPIVEFLQPTCARCKCTGAQSWVQKMLFSFNQKNCNKLFQFKEPEAMPNFCSVCLTLPLRSAYSNFLCHNFLIIKTEFRWYLMWGLIMAQKLSVKCWWNWPLITTIGWNINSNRIKRPLLIVFRRNIEEKIETRVLFIN